MQTSTDQPLFQPVFADAWTHLPPVLQTHYAIRPDSDDRVVVEGTLTVERHWFGRLISPLFRLCGTMVPYEGKGIPVTVEFYSGRGSDLFHFDRTFHFPGRKPYRFHSRMERTGGAELVEWMGMGLGWKLHYEWDGKRLWLKHRGYALKLGNIRIPLRVSALIGRGEAWEEAIDDTHFAMWTSLTHPLFGRIIGYSGTFRIVKTHG